MKKARMNISHSRFILCKLKIFGEIVTTFKFFNFFSYMKEYKKFPKKEVAVSSKGKIVFSLCLG